MNAANNGQVENQESQQQQANVIEHSTPPFLGAAF